MPRGRPKGSKNSPSVPKSLEGMEWGIREVAQNKIIWHSPMQAPYLTKESAELLLAERVKDKSLLSVEIVNMLDREKKFKKITVDTVDESAIIPETIDGGVNDSID